MSCSGRFLLPVKDGEADKSPPHSSDKLIDQITGETKCIDAHLVIR